MAFRTTELVVWVGIAHRFMARSAKIMAPVSAKEEVAATEQRTEKRLPAT